MTILDAALAFHDAGCCVIPAKNDGTKAPFSAWKEYQAERPDIDQLRAWFEDNVYDGIGVICGQTSGNLEMLELEGRAIAEGVLGTYTKLLADHGLADVWARITGGYTEVSAGGGLHVMFRVDGEPRSNTKLASRPTREDELTDEERKILASKPGKVFPRGLVETRGEGGFVVVAPSAGRTHPTGKAWRLVNGGPATIVTVTEEQRDALHAIATLLDQMPQVAPPPPDQPAGSSRDEDILRPGDDYNERADWLEILEPHGWRHVCNFGQARGWRRPGKNRGISATTGHSDTGDRLYVFSISTTFDAERPYSKFAAYTHLEHGGDYSAAARDLRTQGYGGELPHDDDVEDLIQDDEDSDGNTGSQARQSHTSRPALHIGSPAIAAEWLRVNVGQGHLAGMFNRTGEIVHTPREGEDGYIPLTRDEDDGPAQVRPVTASSLASRIQYTYFCYQEDQKKDPVTGATKKTRKAAMFPTSAARVPVDVPDMLPNLRVLRGVVHSPVLRRDGSILHKPGYDADTGLLHLPEPSLHVPQVADNPTAEQVATAVALLDEMVADFQFLTEHDKANYYGLLLTPLLREMVPAPYKLGAIGAPQPGSGKTLLANILRIVHGGVFRSEMPEDDAELRKQVSAILDVTTGPIVHFDNVSGVLRSSTLAGLLTSNRWDDRKLGSMEMIHRANDRLWIITGNNLLLGGDLVRRTLWVTIDPGVPNPHLRTGFAIPNLEEWVREHRGDLLHALLTLARAWIGAGRSTELRAGDGFARWVEAINGIFTAAGVPGTFDTSESARQSVGTDDDDWRDFLVAAHQVFGDRSWTVRELLDQIDTSSDVEGLVGSGRHPIPIDALPTELAERVARSKAGAVVISKSLGRWLMNRDGRWAGNLTVRCIGKNANKIKLWRVEAATATNEETTDAGVRDEPNPANPASDSQTPYSKNGSDQGSTGFTGFTGFHSHYARESDEEVTSEYRGGTTQNSRKETPYTPHTPYPCDRCGTPLHIVLTQAGYTTHPDVCPNGMRPEHKTEATS